MPCSLFSYVANVSFNTFRENKILAKISEFTVLWSDSVDAQSDLNLSCTHMPTCNLCRVTAHTRDCDKDYGRETDSIQNSIFKDGI